MAAVGVYTIWTVTHGCKYLDRSPFQSSIASLLVIYGPIWFRNVKCLPNLCLGILAQIKRFFHFRRPRLVIQQCITACGQFHTAFAMPWLYWNSSTGIYNDDYFDHGDEVLSKDERQAFHAVLNQTHEDEILDQAAAALLPLMKTPGFSGSKNPSPPEIQSIMYLLSSEASLQSNLTAAAAVDELYPSWEYIHEAGEYY